MDTLEISKQDLLNYAPQQLEKLADYLGISRDQSLDELLTKLATTLLGRYQKGTMVPAGLAGLARLAGMSVTQLKNARQLNLSFRGLTGLPSEIGQLSTLQRLDLTINKLSALPKEIGQLSALQRLDLAINKLSALPTEIGQMSALQRLDLSRNQLTTLPTEIGQLSSLKDLNLGNNQLTALPTEIGQLSSLKNLDLYGNPNLRIPISLQLKLQDVIDFGAEEEEDEPESEEEEEETPERRIGDYTFTELQEARNRGEITAAEFQRLQIPFLFPEEAKEAEEPETAMSEAEDCTNETDVMGEVWTDEPEIIITFQTGAAKPYILCMHMATLQRYLTDPSTHMARWVQNPDPGAGPMDAQGYGGIPDLQFPIQQLRGLATMYVVNPDILLSGGEFRAFLIDKNVRLGNRAGSFGEGEMHGQAPGEIIYYLAAEPVDMEEVVAKLQEYEYTGMLSIPTPAESEEEEELEEILTGSASDVSTIATELESPMDWEEPPEPELEPPELPVPWMMGPQPYLEE